MATIVIISVSVAVAALMKASEKKASKEKTVYDYREDPEVLNGFIR